MTEWIAELCRLRETDEAAVLVTVAGVRGSAPREVGAKMLVSLSEAAGTIGGGRLEYECTQIAAHLIADKAAGSGFLRRFPLGSNCGQCCGGVVDILFERIPVAAPAWIDTLKRLWRAREPLAIVTTLDANNRPQKALVTATACEHEGAVPPDGGIVTQAREALDARQHARRIDTPGRAEPFLLIDTVIGGGFDIAVFGAGHVGSALVHILSALDCELRWIDSRRRIFPAKLPANVQCIESGQPDQEVAAMPVRTYYLVMTHSHALDFGICANILARGDFAYCGLIGSTSKRRRFEQRLGQQGISEARLRRLECPIGVPGIANKQPAAIAIAAAAGILRRRERLAAFGNDRSASVHTLRQR